MTGLVLAGAPLLLGGGPVWARGIIAASAGIALLLAARHRIPGGLGPAAVVGAWAFTVIQRVSFPRSLLDALSPGRVESSSRTLAMLEDGEGAWRPLSLDPGATEVAILTSATVVAGWLVGSTIAASLGRRRVMVLAGFSTALTLSVSAVHWLAGSEQLYGVYLPQYSAPDPVAPLMNPNHFGAFLAFGALIQAGLAWSERSPLRRLVWVGFAMASAAATVTTGSRGAAGGLALGCVLFAALALRQRNASPAGGGRRALLRSVLAFSIGLLAVAVIWAAGTQELATQFRQQDYTKLELAAAGGGLALRFPALGVGRGAFGAAFGWFEDGARVTHPENLLVQWSVEWGLPVALAILIVVGVDLWRASVRRRRPESIAGVAALVSLAAHDLVDFSLELPAVALVASVVAGGVTWQGASRTRVPPWLALVVVSSIALSLSLGPGLGWQRAEELRRSVETWPASGLPEELSAAVRDHPLDPGLVYLAAWQAARSGSPDAGRWINRAMELAPRWAAPHVLTAEVLRRRGLERQAALELREAEERQPGAGHELVCSWLGEGDAEAVVAASPSRPAPAMEYLLRASRCESLGASARDILNARLMALAPERAEPHIQMARAEPVPAERVRILEEALGLVSGSDRRNAVLLELSRVHRTQGSLAQALQALEGASDDARGREAWLRERAIVARLQEDDEVADVHFALLRGRARRASAVAELYLLDADAFSRRGDDTSALAALEAAQRIRPDVRTLTRLGRVAASLGRTARARTAYQRACRMADNPHAPACEQWRRLSERR